MSDRKGVFTTDHENFLIEIGVNLIKFNNKFLNLGKRQIVTLVIRGFDNFLLEKIRPDWKLDLIPLIDAGMAGDREEMRRCFVDVTNKRVDIKNLDEEQELQLFDGLFRAIFSIVDYAIVKWINKKQ